MGLEWCIWQENANEHNSGLKNWLHWTLQSNKNGTTINIYSSTGWDWWCCWRTRALLPSFHSKLNRYIRRWSDSHLFSRQNGIKHLTDEELSATQCRDKCSHQYSFLHSSHYGNHCCNTQALVLLSLWRCTCYQHQCQQLTQNSFQTKVKKKR